jgi:hypothetical protein
MANSIPFEFPQIFEEDLRRTAVQLGLPDSAFLGEQGNDARKLVIQSNSNMDVAACPGSGKTTVLIAKLAILAKKWKHRTRGICVLSHTNAAREIIEQRLGNSNEGQRLLSYSIFHVGIVPRFEIRIRRGFPVFRAWPVAPSVKASFIVLEQTGSQALHMYSDGIGASLYEVSVEPPHRPSAHQVESETCSAGGRSTAHRLRRQAIGDD